MKKRFIRIAALALTLAAFAAPAPALAARTTTFVKDQTATALFSNTDGCVSTSVFIVASKNMTRTFPQSRSTTAGASIDILQTDDCASMVLMDAHGVGTLRREAFSVNGPLTWARMNTVFEVTNVDGSTFNLNVDLVWRGTGPLTIQHTHDHFQGENCHTDSFLFGLNRAAVASLRVGDDHGHHRGDDGQSGGNTLNGGGNTLIQGQSTDANIMWANSGQLDTCA